MMQGQIYGKVPSELAWSEDVLTSTVFGALKYISSPNLISSILSNSMNLDNKPLCLPENIERINYFFWPRLQNSEPDLILVVHEEDNVHLLGIEAKYFSRKSSYENEESIDEEQSNSQRDQLAREIEDLYLQSTFTLLGISEGNISSVAMIYLTLESYMPREELKDTVNSIFRHQKCHFTSSQLYWLSWKSFFHHIKNYKSDSYQDHLLVTDLEKYLYRKHLTNFNGFQVKDVTHLSWKYGNKWDVKTVSNLKWSYGG